MAYIGIVTGMLERFALPLGDLVLVLVANEATREVSSAILSRRPPRRLALGKAGRRARPLLLTALGTPQ